MSTHAAPARRIAARALLIAALYLAGISAGRAEEESGTFNFLWENDVIGGTDHHYTNGLELSYLSIEDHLWDWFRSGSNLLPGVADEDHVRVGLTLGQSIFTPDDTVATQPLPDQRPYAGWLYLGVAVVANQGNELDTWALNLGVVGPSAKAQQVQNSFHDWISSAHANGWDNQLQDEFGYQLLFEHRWRNIGGGKKRVGPVEMDFSPHVGFSLGNIATYANAGITLRIGRDLRNDFGVPRIRPSLPGSAFFQPRDGMGWYVFAGIDARGVAYNIFLDGDASTYDVNIRKETFVYDGQAGLAVVWRKFRFAYTYVIRSHEFKGQQQPDRFGSVGLTFRF
jgi:lipid A 3-O-deacylase